MDATCTRCGVGFLADAAWKTVCRACWLETHERVECASCGQSFWRDADWKKVCLNCWRAAREPPQQKGSTAPVAIPADMLASLIRLCHPDRHGNSEHSNRVTQWLLSQRDNHRRTH